MTIGYQDIRWRTLDGPKANTGYISIPLQDLRKVTSNDIIAVASVGGVLAKDTTPIFEYKATSTDGALRLNWAATVVVHVAYQIALPGDLDPSQAINMRFLAAMAGATDTPTFSTDVYFNVGGTKRTNATTAVTGTTPAVYTASIAASQIPTLPWTMSCEITPAAHGTDALFLYALWLEYSKL